MHISNNDPATTNSYTLSLHDALPISHQKEIQGVERRILQQEEQLARRLDQLDRRDTDAQNRERSMTERDRKSTRLNSSHIVISYAVFCLKKKKKKKRYIECRRTNKRT